MQREMALPRSHSVEDFARVLEVPSSTEESSEEDQFAPSLPLEEEKIQARITFEDGDTATIVGYDWGLVFATIILIRERCGTEIIKVEKL